MSSSPRRRGGGPGAPKRPALLYSDSSAGTSRLLQRDGPFHQSLSQFNRKVKWEVDHTHSFWCIDIYRSLIAMPLWKILVVTALLYLASFVIFTVPYVIVGTRCGTGFGSWLDTFFFSVETEFTIGYGTPDPFFKGCWSMAIVISLQAITGTILDAVAIGLIFDRLSRPTKRATSVLFSKSAIMRYIPGLGYAFEFRAMELRKHQMSESHVRSFVVRHDIGRPGDPVRYYQQHNLRIHAPDDELGGYLLLAIPQTISHFVDGAPPEDGEPLRAALGHRAGASVSGQSQASMPVGRHAGVAEFHQSPLLPTSEWLRAWRELRASAGKVVLPVAAPAAQSHPPEPLTAVSVEEPWGAGVAGAPQNRAAQLRGEGPRADEGAQDQDHGHDEDDDDDDDASSQTRALGKPRAAAFTLGRTARTALELRELQFVLALRRGVRHSLAVGPAVGPAIASMPSLHQSMAEQPNAAAEAASMPGREGVAAQAQALAVAAAAAASPEATPTGRVDQLPALLSGEDAAAAAEDSSVDSSMPRVYTREEVEQFWRESQLEVVVFIEGVDAVTSDTAQARHSYTADDIIFDADFLPCCRPSRQGAAEIDMSKFHVVVSAPSPEAAHA